MKTREPSTKNTPEAATATKPSFQDRLWKFLSCPNLAAPPESPDPPAAPGPLRSPPPRQPAPPKPPAAGRSATVGGGIRIGIRSAHDFFAVSIRITDMGLLSDFGFRISSYTLHITSDLLHSPLTSKLSV